MNEQDRPQEAGKKANKFIQLFSGSDDPMIRLRQKLVLQGAVFVCVCLVIVGVLFGMTAAWYTNVVKSEALAVKAAAWGFDAEVTCTDGSGGVITAAPGDTGDLSGFSLTNNASQDVNVLMQVDKTALDGQGALLMPVEMQKRIYFYYSNAQNETVWLTKDQGYVLRNNDQNIPIFEPDSAGYIFSMGGAGSVDDENIPLDLKSLGDIHWLWVYDLVGYYVKVSGSVSLENGDYILTELNELEYLAPVVYDPYDPSTVYDSDGYLNQVEGQDLNVFLDALGAGTEIRNCSGYYLVSVDPAEGTAVLLYLLTKTEIEAATAYDTAHAGEGSFAPTMVFIGEAVSASQPAVPASDDGQTPDDGQAPDEGQTTEGEQNPDDGQTTDDGQETEIPISG